MSDPAFLAQLAIYALIMLGAALMALCGIECARKDAREARAKSLQLEALKAAGVKAPLDVRV